MIIARLNDARPLAAFCDGDAMADVSSKTQRSLSCLGAVVRSVRHSTIELEVVATPWLPDSPRK
jgi:hypothetical protein